MGNLGSNGSLRVYLALVSCCLVVLLGVLVWAQPRAKPTGDHARLLGLLDSFMKDRPAVLSPELLALYGQVNPAAVQGPSSFAKEHYSWRVFPLLPEIMRRLPNADDEGKLYLLELLSRLNERGSREHLEYIKQLALNSKASSDVRTRAVWLLGKWRACSAIETLLTLAHCDDPQISLHAIVQLTAFSKRQNVKAFLIQTLRSQDPMTRFFAARGLISECLHLPAVDVVLAVMRSDDPVARRMAFAYFQKLSGLALGCHVIYDGLAKNATLRKFRAHLRALPDDRAERLRERWRTIWEQPEQRDEVIRAVEAWWWKHKNSVHFVNSAGVRLEAK